MKVQGHRVVAGACDMGLNTMSGAVRLTLDSSAGRLATRTADGALTFADWLVEKYIPELEHVNSEFYF